MLVCFSFEGKRRGGSDQADRGVGLGDKMGIKNSTAWVTFNLVVIFFVGWETIICGKISTSVINEMFNFHASSVRRCIIKHILENKGEINA